MAQTLKWSEESLQDISGIAEFIARDSAYYAQRVVEAILSKGESVVHFPEAGRVVPELGQPSIREQFVFSYRLIYQQVGDEILILAVIHGKRLLESDSRFVD
jgi:toxin ParE1/3/4